ncbi:hypothetical protein B0I35DRAFT_434666 [Stachybotrys elegans]|uniref:Integral membrane protein n=1 Tax=Stachybotrys elegans TaxID=80388 RepID=A0A8K0WRG3_9HYPO|nr:hypothetical protein B0I35DRAFT_434666 [Stachybotrys elegans]
MTQQQPHFYGLFHHHATHIKRPIRRLNPTRRYIPYPTTGSGGYYKDGLQKTPRAYHVWRSRDNRKGRHALVVGPEYAAESGHQGPQPTNNLRSTAEGIAKLFLRYPIWDISYDVAAIFTIGSAIWVVNGFFAWLPLAAPSTAFHSESSWGAGITAIVGATVFEVGSVFLMLEAINENRSDCFGWAVEETIDGLLHIEPAPSRKCTHHHPHRDRFIKATHADKSRQWLWLPTWHELRTHYLRDIGFLACFSQLIGATIFWISGITAIPPILNGFSVPAENGLYWLPQVVGGTGFIVSSLLFMLEVQPRWYIPAPSVLGWHVGLWNFVGAIGFTLCGALGFGGTRASIEYALTLSSFIGSWAFLIGSLIQLYESLNKYPLWVVDNPSKYV